MIFHFFGACENGLNGFQKSVCEDGEGCLSKRTVGRILSETETQAEGLLKSYLTHTNPPDIRANGNLDNSRLLMETLVMKQNGFPSLIKNTSLQ